MIMWRQIMVFQESDIQQMAEMMNKMNKSMKEATDKISKSLGQMTKDIKDLNNGTKEN